MRLKPKAALAALLTSLCFTAPAFVSAQRVTHTEAKHDAQPAPAKPAIPVPESPVTIDGKVLFSVPGVLSFPASARARAITARIGKLSKDVTFNPSSLTISDGEDSTDIMASDLVLMSVTDADATLAHTPRQQLARQYITITSSAITQLRHQYSLKSISIGAVYALLVTLLLVLLFRLLALIFAKIYARLHAWHGTALRIQRFELLSADKLSGGAIGLVRLFRLALVLNLLYLYAYVVLRFFPWTEPYAQQLVSYVVSPLKIVISAVVAYLPNLFFIAVILAVVYYIGKFIATVFREIGKKNVVIRGFYPEWADPTWKIVRFLLFALTLIIVFPYLPGSKSPAFQGVAVFVGALISLGSSSAVANIVSGIILTYMRAFNPGDRVRIDNTEGDIIEKNLLVTRIRTIKNVETTIANSLVLSSHISNFSASVQREGLILHTSVTIGYDAPWRTVHQLLITAALATDNILHDPAPFVLQKALDDFYVQYEINGYTAKPSVMARTYSDLHTKIQDTFNEAGVEIMSSHYSSMRDGNHTTIPESYRPADYRAPGFRITNLAPTKDKEEPPVK
ncbi:mechanosensitive ion channel [Granulicella sp. 5B5]|uniref:mechanosensitive ion channel family protein n=1 Tax=Granulicella sp. 5B5 TaxID=1617967 RepID=UPI0015F5DDF6|nr:mechanosensitive ion channel family protein [Granulicella sp. 5B5]QMV19061.1 mechanosensitive ion channel [Granulicella sp. 5B5]